MTTYRAWPVATILTQHAILVPSLLSRCTPWMWWHHSHGGSRRAWVEDQKGDQYHSKT